MSNFPILGIQEILCNSIIYKSWAKTFLQLFFFCFPIDLQNFWFAWPPVCLNPKKSRNEEKKSLDKLVKNRKMFFDSKAHLFSRRFCESTSSSSSSWTMECHCRCHENNAQGWSFDDSPRKNIRWRQLQFLLHFSGDSRLSWLCSSNVSSTEKRRVLTEKSNC